MPKHHDVIVISYCYICLILINYKSNIIGLVSWSRSQRSSFAINTCFLSVSQPWPCGRCQFSDWAQANAYWILRLSDLHCLLSTDPTILRMPVTQVSYLSSSRSLPYSISRSLLCDSRAGTPHSPGLTGPTILLPGSNASTSSTGPQYLPANTSSISFCTYSFDPAVPGQGRHTNLKFFIAFG